MAKNAATSTGKLYEKGTVLVTEKPFAFVLSGKFHSQRCDYCFTKSALLSCSDCTFAYYCNRECQKKAWAYHKIECPSIRKIGPKNVPDTIRFLARIIIRLKKYGIKEQAFDLETKSRTFYDLMTHSNEIVNDPNRMKPFVFAKTMLGEYLDKDLLPDPVELLGIFGRMVINTFTILDEDLRSIGSGLYVEASVFDHSCAPNAVYTFYGTTISIRTIKNVQSKNFSNIYISYKDTLDLPAERQKELEEQYYFMCQCERCTDFQLLKEMTCIICQNEHCGSAIPGGLADEGSPTCPNCNLEVPDAKLEEMKEVISFTTENLKKMEEVQYLDVCIVCLNKQKHLLHPMNMYNVKVLKTAFDSCVALKKFEDAFMYGIKAKDYLKKYYGDWSVTFGLFLMNLGEVAGALDKLDDQRRFMLEAVDILVPALGSEHPLITNELLPRIHPI